MSNLNVERAKALLNDRLLEFYTKDKDQVKACTRCKVVKHFYSFHKLARSSDGYCNRCKLCASEIHQQTKEQKAKIVKERYMTGGEHWKRRILDSARRRAVEQNVDFTIGPHDIELTDICPVLHIPLRLEETGRTDNCPTIDRRIPSLGYVPGNVLIISWLANRIKNDQTDPEIFRKIAQFLERN